VSRIALRRAGVRVEIFDNKDPADLDPLADKLATGLRFAAQVKGTTRLEGRGELILFRVDTRHLQHWLDVEPDPVFVLSRR
jgi:hypothetical protein